MVYGAETKKPNYGDDRRKVCHAVSTDHGGDWAGYQAEFGGLPLDFSANISPLGLPEGVREALMDNIDSWERYPDPACRRLREALGEYYAIDPQRIVCGNGAADLIYRAVRVLRPRRALLAEPGFSEYERALTEVGCEIRRYLLDETNDFELTADILKEITPEIDLLFLCNPNNPTGRLIAPDLMDRIRERCRETGTFLALDECFLEMTDRWQESLIRRDCEAFVHEKRVGLHDKKDFGREKGTGSQDNEYFGHEKALSSQKIEGVLPGNFSVGLPEETSPHRSSRRGEYAVIRAFTKSFAMPGLRLGYLVCSETQLAEKIGACGPPWAVSAPAQIAGVAALRENEYLPTLRKQIREERAYLQEGLSALGMRVIPGEANFLLFRSREEDLDLRLRAQGILIRDASNFHGLSRGWYRIAVQNHEENERLLAAMATAKPGEE